MVRRVANIVVRIVIRIVFGQILIVDWTSMEPVALCIGVLIHHHLCLGEAMNIFIH